MSSVCAPRWRARWASNDTMRLTQPIDAEGVLLKQLRLADAAGPYLKWFSDSLVTRFLSPVDGRMTTERLEAYIADNECAGDALLAGMFLDAGARHVGNIRLSGIERQFSRASVGIVIGDRGEWGKGVASRAIRALTGFAHAELGIAHLYAGCHTDNVGSIYAFRKASYVDFAQAPPRIRTLPALREGIGIEHVMMVHCDA
jgi:[ribosomal protein S5]-alanine N-acetyltransferase